MKNNSPRFRLTAGWSMAPFTDLAKMGGGSSLLVKSSHHKLCYEMIGKLEMPVKHLSRDNEQALGHCSLKLGGEVSAKPAELS